MSGFRNRSIDYQQTGTNLVWRLGDIIHSSVAAVGAPSADYAVANNDTTYAAFQQQYANRCQMIYVGPNDGIQVKIVHAHLQPTENADPTPN